MTTMIVSLLAFVSLTSCLFSSEKEVGVVPPVPLNAQSKYPFAKAALIELYFSPDLDNLKDEWKKKRSFHIKIPLTAATRDELISIASRMKVVDVKWIPSRVTYMRSMYVNFFDEKEQALGSTRLNNVTSTPPQESRHGSRYYHLNEKDSARFHELVKEAINAQNMLKKPL